MFKFVCIYLVPPQQESTAWATRCWILHGRNCWKASNTSPASSATRRSLVMGWCKSYSVSLIMRSCKFTNTHLNLIQLQCILNCVNVGDATEKAWYSAHDLLYVLSYSHPTPTTEATVVVILHYQSKSELNHSLLLIDYRLPIDVNVSAFELCARLSTWHRLQSPGDPETDKLKGMDGLIYKINRCNQLKHNLRRGWRVLSNRPIDIPVSTRARSAWLTNLTLN